MAEITVRKIRFDFDDRFDFDHSDEEIGSIPRPVDDDTPLGAGADLTMTAAMCLRLCSQNVEGPNYPHALSLVELMGGLVFPRS
jgi:hypothetical protein